MITNSPLNQNDTPAGVPTTQNSLLPACEVAVPASWPHVTVLHGLEIDGVIERLAGMFVDNHPKPESAKKLLAVVREATQKVSLGHEPVNRDLYSVIAKDIVKELPDKATFGEKLSNLLPVVWADYRLWQAFARTPPESPILKDALFAHMLLKFYNLQIPFRDSVWLELRAQPIKWNFLRWLMTASGADSFFNLESASAKDELTAGERSLLGELFLGKLLGKYVGIPLNDWRSLIWHMQYPPQVLRRLSQAAASLSKDAAWCAKNPDRYVARVAPTAGHRVRGLHDVKAIEDMVGLLRGDPGISDYALAKAGMGRITAAGRKLAKEAKLLAFYRDGVPVQLHKSRGDKNAPTSPA